jgi:hypothetical protein
MELRTELTLLELGLETCQRVDGEFNLEDARTD